MKKIKKEGHLHIIKKAQEQDLKVEEYLKELTEDEKKTIRLIADIYVNSLLYNIENQSIAA
jgi:hypothetical protein